MIASGKAPLLSYLAACWQILSKEIKPEKGKARKGPFLSLAGLQLAGLQFSNPIVGSRGIRD